VLALPGFFGSALDPFLGLAGDTSRRRALIFVGGLAFAVSAALAALAVGFWTLLAALLIGNPASGAFVSLAQATLMDAEPEQRERNMARWTIAGSVGYVAGPALIAVAVIVGVGWRGVLLPLAVAAVPLAFVARRGAPPPVRDAQRAYGGSVLAALRDRSVLRWLLALESADLLGDVLHGFIALYFVDVVRVDAVQAALAVSVWTGAAFVGDVLLLAVLQRMQGLAYLRASALAAAVLYPLFLLLPSPPAKLVLLALLGLLNAGWYALPKAALYAALPGRSGTAVAVGGVAGFAGAAVPAALGFAAQAVGLQATMWILVLAPVGLLTALPRIDSAGGSRRRRAQG
jgi:MFS transporter, FSR family, fosmidomycin resistance protein